MQQFVDEDNKKYVVHFGVSSWSSSFELYCDSEQIDMDRLKERCNRLLPEWMKKTHPANECIKWIRVYKLTRSWRDT